MKRARQLLIRIGVVTAAVSITHASAAALTMTTDSLAAGGSTIASCDPDGVDVSYTLSGDSVTQMTVQGIAPGCGGGELSATLVDTSENAVGEGGPQTVTGSSETLSISPQPDSLDVAAVHVVIVGP
jgi:hypothetical protein